MREASEVREMMFRNGRAKNSLVAMIYDDSLGGASPTDTQTNTHTYNFIYIKPSEFRRGCVRLRVIFYYLNGI